MVPSTPTIPSGIHLTGSLNVPAKIAPAGRPSVPLPTIMNVPPAANLPPLTTSPDVMAAVVNDTVPHGTAVEQVPKPRVVPVRFEPVRVRPAELPVRVPPVLLKSMLPAKAAIGRAMASKTSNTIRFILPPDVLRTQSQTFFGSFRPPLAVARKAFRSNPRSPLGTKLAGNISC